jgi:RimJ/RimL family protein N-acetyltransferase
LTLSLRQAQLEDAPVLLQWRNDDEVRAASFNQSLVAPDEHTAWLRRLIRDPDRSLFVVLEDGEAVGEVRLDHRGGGIAEVSIVLAPEARGRRLGPVVLDHAAAEAARQEQDELRARVRPENSRSLRAFEAAGFHELSRTDEVVELTRTLD